jgi:hypothetical protein
VQLQQLYIFYIYSKFCQTRKPVYIFFYSEKYSANINHLSLLIIIRKGGLRMDGSEIRSADGYDIGTWHFLKAGWWVLHIVGIAGTFYVG